MSAGLLMMALGALFFIPAALTRMYPLFLLGLFIQGRAYNFTNGIQSIHNHPRATGERSKAHQRYGHLQWHRRCDSANYTWCSNSAGRRWLRQKLAGFNAAQQNESLAHLADRVILPYAVMFLTLVILALLIHFSSLPEVDAEEQATGESQHRKTSIFHFPICCSAWLRFFFMLEWKSSLLIPSQVMLRR